MKALIVYESLWGNTRRIAEAIADGLGGDTSLVSAATAPETLPEDIDLLVVGGPTHAFSMSRPQTRAEAAKEGAAAAPQGVREWLDALPRRSTAPRLVTFDTKVGHTRLSGSAAKSAAKAARAHGLHAEESVDFFVTGKEGPLEDGELERATEWGRSLVR